MMGCLHLIEHLDHVFPLKDGSGLWASGYWQLSEEERGQARMLFLHKTKTARSFWGGEIVRVVPASDFAAKAREHGTDPEGRWILVVRPQAGGRQVEWEGADHKMAYKSMV